MTVPPPLPSSSQANANWWEEKSKPRRRWLRPRNVILFTIFALLAWGGVFIYRVMYAEPVIKTDYRPRHVDMVRQKQGMPADAENGWLILRGLVEKIDSVNAKLAEEVGRAETYEMLTPEVLYNPAAQVHGFDMNEVRRVNLLHLERMKGAGVFDDLDRLRRAPFGVRVSPEERMLVFMLPEVGKARMLTRANAARMHLAHQRGDEEERFSALDQSMAMAQLESRQGSMIEHLVGIAIFAAATTELKHEFIERPPTEAECARTLAILDQRLLADRSAALEGERLLNYDVVQCVFTDNGRGNGRLIVTRLNTLQGGDNPANPNPKPDDWLDYKISNLLGLFAADRRQSIAKIDEFFDQAARQAAMPRKERLADAFDAMAFAENIPKSYPVVAILVPALGSAIRSEDQHVLNVAGLRLMIAIERYRARTGGYPAVLADLAPSDIPVDPFTGMSFGYRRFAPGEDADKRGYLLYSFGADGQDNGGKMMRVNWDALRNDRGTGYDYVINDVRPKPAPAEPPAEAPAGVGE